VAIGDEHEAGFLLYSAGALLQDNGSMGPLDVLKGPIPLASTYQKAGRWEHALMA